MTRGVGPGETAWADAAFTAAIAAIDPAFTGGVVLRAQPGPVRDRWLDLIGVLAAPSVLRKAPANVTSDGLLGGLDLAATLALGRPVARDGLLAAADGGVLLMAMAERASNSTAAHVSAALDNGEIALERDGFQGRSRARFGVIAIDESVGGESGPPNSLMDRLAFWLDLEPVRLSETRSPCHTPDEVAAARERFPAVTASDETVEALCAAALQLGIGSIRAPLLALRAARVISALEGRVGVQPSDAALAARLVLGPRATVAPPAEDLPPEADQEPAAQSADEDQPQTAADPRQLEDVVLAAARATVPRDLLAKLALAKSGRARAPTQGRSGALQRTSARGRPAGTLRGEPRRNARLDIVETLRAAAPWQTLRRAQRSERAIQDASTFSPSRIELRRDDFRVKRYKQRSETVTIFVVDASGSAALHRLAEAKGAVELVLAEAYVRRDQVALVAFRGRSAELVLPPTRSLVRAKRALAGLPGGGGTPLAAGLEMGLAVAGLVRRKGQTPVLILLTDGRPNIARGGLASREQAETDAVAAARATLTERVTALLVDTSARPQAFSRRLAAEMGATYLLLPYSDSRALTAAAHEAAITQR